MYKKLGGFLSILLGIVIFILEQHFLNNALRHILKTTYDFWHFDFIGLSIFILASLIPILFIWTGIGLLRNKNFINPGMFLGIAVSVAIVVIFIFAYSLSHA